METIWKTEFRCWIALNIKQAKVMKNLELLLDEPPPLL
jgi:hypothetical protein